jgi:riboflavin kinase/FMN adenylyltransferase
MKTIKKKSLPGSAIAVGNFDGYHLGHQKIVETLLEVARQKNLSPVILTFSPNPKIFFKLEHRLIISEKEKKKILNQLPVDRVFFLDFRTFHRLDGFHFLRDVLIGKYNMAHIVVGENFRFGKNRENSIKSLSEFSSRLGFESTVVKTIMRKGVKISSSLIRKKLVEGKVEEAKLLLGRPYYIDGQVIPGDGVGRKLGFPTINIKIEGLILPEGVFRTRVRIGRQIFDSITNIGYKPTFKTGDIGIETHIFGFDRIIYGKPVRIFFEKKIRNEQQFASKTDLVEQIKKDIENIEVDKGSHI